MDADFETGSPAEVFAGLPDVVTLRPLDFAPASGRSLYEEWLAAR